MAAQVNIGGNGTLFVGEDKTVRLEVLDAAGAPVDIAGWTLLFDVRTTDQAPTPLLTITPTITGTFNATRAMNTQRAIVMVTDTQMNLFQARPYRYSVKRMDDGSETVLAYGDFRPQKATAP